MDARVSSYHSGKEEVVRRNLRVGDMVIVMGPNSPRGYWPLGKILKSIAGSDGAVRPIAMLSTLQRK